MQTFETNSTNFDSRLWNKFKVFTIPILIVFILIFIKKINFNLSFLIISIIYISITFFYSFFYAINEINKIEISESKLILSGKKYNNDWQKIININQTTINIKVISNKVFCNIYFYLVLNHKNSKYIINFENNWSKDEVLNIFKTYKKLKNEKIIIDEQLVLNSLAETIKKCQ